MLALRRELYRYRLQGELLVRQAACSEESKLAELLEVTTVLLDVNANTRVLG